MREKKLNKLEILFISIVTNIRGSHYVLISDKENNNAKDLKVFFYLVKITGNNFLFLSLFIETFSIVWEKF